MRSKSRYIIFPILVILVSTLISQSFAGTIVYPWRAVKAITGSGTSFNILFNNIYAAQVDSAILEGPFNRVILGIDSVSTGRFEYDTFTHASVNNRIRASVPAGTPEDLYNLVIKCGGETHVSLKSVKVISQFKEAHSFIHISDLHMTRQWIGTPENGYAKELELFDRFTQVANVIDPDFIIITGDNIMDYTRINADSTGWGGINITDAAKRPLVEEKWKSCFEGSSGFRGIDGLDSPVFIIPGNHDYYGVPQNDYKSKALQWNNLCGIRVYGLSYAGTRIIASDDFLGDPVTDIPDKAPMSGLQGKVLENFLRQYGPGLIRIMAQHRNDRIDTAFLNKHKISILLHGHDHKPFQGTIGTTPTLISRPGVVCRSGVTDIEGELGYFRIFRINGSSFEATSPLRFTKDPAKPYNNIELNLTLKFDKPNDGSSANNTALIDNRLGVDLPACHIRFVMRKGKYRVNNGTIYQVIESGKRSVIDVRVDAGPGKVTSVVISKIKTFM
jgi:predicted MPP superfamily phosphohydrolase